MTSFTSNTLFQETRPEERKTMEQILSAQATLQSSCAMWAADYAPEIMTRPWPHHARGNLVVSDSSLALISGGKRNRKRADLAQDMNYNRSTVCSHCEVKMCWGKDLTSPAWTVKSTMKELKKRSEFKEHDFYVTVYWSGNELVGSVGSATSRSGLSNAEMATGPSCSTTAPRRSTCLRSAQIGGALPTSRSSPTRRVRTNAPAHLQPVHGKVAR